MEMPSGVIVNLQAKQEKRILASRNYTAASNLEFATEHYQSTKSSWRQKSETLREYRRLQKSENLREYQMGYSPVKNEHAEDGSSHSVEHGATVADKFNSQKQAFSRNGRGCVVDSNDHAAPVKFSTEQKTTSSRSRTLGNVNGHAIGDKRPSSLSLKNFSRESAQKNGSMVVKGSAPVDNINDEAVDKKKPNGFSLGKISKMHAQTDRSFSMKILKHQRNFNEIEHVGAGLIDGKQTNAKLLVGSDAEKPSNAKQASCLPDIKKRLASVYGKIMVVNNVSVADEVVYKLMHQYRHFVHACDTEVCTLLAINSIYFSLTQLLLH